MKPFIVFLDHDGPTCTSRASYASGRHDDWDPIACGIIARHCAETGARLVICSARRSLDELPGDLARMGLAPFLFDDPVHWRTGHDPDGIRGNEVDAWNAANPGHRWAIVDDERGGYAPHHLRWLVHTDMHTGFNLRDLSRLERYMGLRTSPKDMADASAQKPRITLAQMAKDVGTALDQGDEDRARDILALIADHPLAQ